MKPKGFTIIEILVVISTIGLIASILLVAMNSSVKKGRDARKISDLKQITNALQLFYEKTGRMPLSYNCGGVYCSNGTGHNGACEKPVPALIGGTSTNMVPEAYERSMQELVDAGILATIPKSPGGPGYCYYNFSAHGLYTNSNIGTVILTELEAGEPTTTGIPPSCRPFNSVGAQWCEQTSTRLYCLCNPYEH
jgi:prepilin-type N-terminal cleavage/methylation domain-containing protein